MKRDINKLRDLESGVGASEEYDIIRKKKVIKKILESDPDIKEILGQKQPKPLNKYKDADNPTEDELKQRQEILDWNEGIKHEQIVPWIKMNGLQKEVLNFIMFDIEDKSSVYVKDRIKTQTLTVWCVVSEEDMDTEYDIPRADLLGYLVKDLLNWSNCCGSQMVLTYDNYRIFDTHYYSRQLEFTMKAQNGIRPQSSNRYDRLPD